MIARQDGGDEAANDPTGPKRLRSAGELRSGEYALLKALLLGPVSREAADRIACASNAPDLVFSLRSSDVRIDTELRVGLNRLGKRTRYGIYSLTPAGRTVAVAMFRLQAEQQAADQKRRPADDAQE